MKKYFFILIITAVLFNTKTFGIRFNHLTTDEGLSQISVKPLYEDERGFIWAGTRDGLNLYNGNNIQFFKHEKNSSNTIISNRVEKIVGNKNGKIYLRCAMDVMEYDFRNETFTTLLLGDVTTIYYNEHLYVARGNNILIKK
ncbi:MAG: hybrid sensor histidine kinase/response regulator, partial [Paludibacter sp.]